MSEVIDVLIYNALAFGIELTLLILVVYTGLTFILRLSHRITKWSAIKIDDEVQQAWNRRVKRASRIAIAVIGLLLLIFNLILSLLKINALSTMWAYLTGISLADLVPIGIALIKVSGIIGAALLLNLVLQKALEFGRSRLQGIKFLQRRLDEINELLKRFKLLIKYSVMMGAILSSAYILDVPAAWQPYLRFLAFGIVVFYGSRLLVQIIPLAIDILFSFSSKFAQIESPLKYLGSLQHLSSLTKRAVEYFIYAGAATLAFGQLTARVISWGNIAIRIIAIFFISRVLVEVCALFINEFFLAPADEEVEITRQIQQRQTLAPLVLSVLRYAIYFAALIMVLREAEIDPTPLLAGAGILGVAVGLGAQTLVTDIVSGFFIIFENLYFVGDFIECAGVEGYVEEIGVRITKIRDRAGKLHAIPNGEIRKVASHSKEFVNAIVDISIAYEADIEKVVHALEKAGEQLFDENTNVLAPTRVVGILEFGGSEIVMRTSTRVKPAMDFEVANEFRRRIKEIFDREDIEIPYARRVIIFQREGDRQAAVEEYAQQRQSLPDSTTPPDEKETGSGGE